MRASPTLRLLLADESPTTRHKLREELKPLGFIEIVGEACRSQEVLDLFFRLLPTVVVLPVCLPGQGGFDVLRCIKRADPGCAVILTTRWPEPFVEETGRLLGAAAVCSTIGGFSQIRNVTQGLLRIRNNGSH